LFELTLAILSVGRITPVRFVYSTIAHDFNHGKGSNENFVTVSTVYSMRNG